MSTSKQNKVKNKQTPVSETPEMNDRDFSTDLLAMEKYMTASYGVALNEASNHALYESILSIFTETQNKQREIYNLMFKEGWYALSVADQSQVQQSYEQHQTYKNQFPNSTSVQ